MSSLVYNMAFVVHSTGGMAAMTSSLPLPSPNRYPGTCHLCGSGVPAGVGFFLRADGRTVVLCTKHPQVQEVARARASSPVICLTLVGDEVQVKPQGFLGGDLFEKYRVAAAGAAYRGTARASFAPVAQVAQISRRLVEAGFAVEASEEVRAAAQIAADRHTEDTVSAADRTAEVDLRLRASGLALFPFQEEGVRWLAPLSGGILGDDQGLGKTIQVLTAIPQGAGPGVVVVCPKVAKGVWSREAARWRPDLQVTTLSGRGSFRWPEPGEVVVINYDLLPDEAQRQALLEGCPAGLTLVADEGHALKAGGGKRGSKRGQAFEALSERVRARGGRSWVVTGTPILNRPQELWALLRMVGMHLAVFGGWARFVRLMGGRTGTYGIVWTGAIDPEVPALLRRALLRREKRDVLTQLPQKIVEIVDVDVDAGSRRSLDRLQAEIMASGADVDVAGAVDAQANRGEVGFSELSKARETLARAKIPAVVDLVEELEEAGEPVVVFSAHRAPVDVLAAREGWAAITGDTSDNDRTEIVARFQAGELRGVAGTIQAMGVAVTLTRACEMVVCDPSWVPALNHQAEDRIHRIGQDRAVRIRYLRADHPVDRRHFAVAAVKCALVARSVGAAAVAQGAVTAATIDVSGLAPAPRATVDATAALDDLLQEIADAAQRGDVAKIRKISLQKTAWAIASRGLSISSASRSIGEDGEARDPRNAREMWTALALRQLAGNDEDRAQVENGIGFSKADVYLGHALCASLPHGLTDLEWAVATHVCQHYPRQVGRPPADPET
jgi:hypothetical protein